MVPRVSRGIASSVVASWLKRTAQIEKMPILPSPNQLPLSFEPGIIPQHHEGIPTLAPLCCQPSHSGHLCSNGGLTVGNIGPLSSRRLSPEAPRPYDTGGRLAGKLSGEGNRELVRAPRYPSTRRSDGVTRGSVGDEVRLMARRNRSHNNNEEHEADNTAKTRK